MSGTIKTCVAGAALIAPCVLGALHILHARSIKPVMASTAAPVTSVALPLAGSPSTSITGGDTFSQMLAARAAESPPMRTGYCWATAGQHFAIDPLLLVAIAQVESNLSLQAVNVNSNGSRDLGLMQINTVHLPRLRKAGVTEMMLRTDPCTSIMAAAEILAGNMRRDGATWKAVGAYNAGHGTHRTALRARYAKKVQRVYRTLLSERTTLHASPAPTAETDRELLVNAEIVSFRADRARRAARLQAS